MSTNAARHTYIYDLLRCAC